MMKWIAILMLLPFIAASQTTISGHVMDGETNEGLIGVTIVDEFSDQGTVTNAFGFFSLTLNGDSIRLRASYVGYKTAYQNIIPQSRLSLELYMTPSVSSLQSVEVRADRFIVEEAVTSTEVGVFHLTPKEASIIPSIGGEADILKISQLMPGILRGGEGTTALYVRGGTDDQNLVTLDDATVYNLSHLFGFFSVFNTDAIRDITVTKGGFPAERGGRLSAVMDTRMQEGNPKKIDVKGGVGLLTSRLTIDGPIVRDKATFMLAGRRTYIDKVLELASVDMPYFFYDLNAKASYRLNARDRLYISGYFGDDVLKVRESAEDEQGDLEKLSFGFNLGNFTSTIRWNHIYGGDRLFSNITLIQTRFKYDIEGDFVDNSLLIRSQIQDWGLKGKWEYFRSPTERIDFGAEVIWHLFRPNIVNTSGEISDFLRSRQGELLTTREISIYGGMEKEVTNRVTMYTGLRLSSSDYAGGIYLGAEPRINLNVKTGDLTSIKTSYSVMRQYMHRVSSSSIVLPTDLWYPVTASVGPQTSHQFSSGVFHGIPSLGLNVSFEGYFKRLSNLIEYREGARLLLNDNFEKELVNGDGNAYGLEFLIRKRTGSFTGWISYTLSKSTRKFDDLNQGNRYLAKYDRRHDIALVGIIRMSPRVDLSWNWVFTSGGSFTPQTGQYLMPNATLSRIDIVPVYSARNAVKISPTHRLDLNFIVKTGKPKRFRSEWQFSIYNFYNRSSPYQISITSNGRAFQYVQPGLFGFIPSVSYNFSF